MKLSKNPIKKHMLLFCLHLSISFTALVHTHISATWFKTEKQTTLFARLFRKSPISKIKRILSGAPYLSRYFNKKKPNLGAKMIAIAKGSGSILKKTCFVTGRYFQKIGQCASDSTKTFFRNFWGGISFLTGERFGKIMGINKHNGIAPYYQPAGASSFSAPPSSMKSFMSGASFSFGYETGALAFKLTYYAVIAATLYGCFRIVVSNNRIKTFFEDGIKQLCQTLFTDPLKNYINTKIESVKNTAQTIKQTGVEKIGTVVETCKDMVNPMECDIEYNDDFWQEFHRRCDQRRAKKETKTKNEITHIFDSMEKNIEQRCSEPLPQAIPQTPQTNQADNANNNSQHTTHKKNNFWGNIYELFSTKTKESDDFMNEDFWRY